MKDDISAYLKWNLTVILKLFGVAERSWVYRHGNRLLYTWAAKDHDEP